MSDGAVQYRPSPAFGPDADFAIPVQWPMDLPHLTRRIARWVGWKRCLIYRRPFWSDDTRHVFICESKSCRNASGD